MSIELQNEVTRKRRVAAKLPSHSHSTVTVVITCYNYERFLREAVYSAITQVNVKVDVIIVDDASNDGSLNLAHSLAKMLHGVQVIGNEVNVGPVRSFNTGAQAATGEFLVRLDADDLLTPGSLERAVAVAQAFPSVGLVYGHPLHFSGSELPHARTKASRWLVWPGLEWLEGRCKQGRNVITSPEVLMRRSIVSQVGLQADLKHSHDMEHWLRIAAFSDVAYVQGADQAWHRDHEGSLSAREVDSIVDLDQRMQAFECLFSGVAGTIDDADHLLTLARRSLGRSALAAAGHALDANLSRERVFEPYLAHAISEYPELQNSRRYLRVVHRIGRSQRNPVSKSAALFRRSVFRISSEIEWFRWHRTGVY